MTSEQRVGLRERKKARTRAAIQDAALRLYLERGYHETTTEQIAEAAEVSPSTFFRYFPTKEETVLYDRLDPIFIEVFLNQPAELSPLAAVRRAIRQVFEDIGPEALSLEQTRWRLVAEVPKLRATLALRIEEGTTMMTEAVAKRVGRKPDDIAVRTWTGALIGAVSVALFTSLDNPEADAVEIIDRSLAYLEAGLPL